MFNFSLKKSTLSRVVRITFSFFCCPRPAPGRWAEEGAGGGREGEGGGGG